MLTRQVQLYVKNDFVLPDVYSKGTLEEVEEALLVGANIQGIVKTRRGNDEIKKITELKDGEIARIQGMYNE